MSESKNDQFPALTLAILTISDRSFRGEREDRTGPELKAFIEGRGAKVVELAVLPDDKDLIKQHLIALCDRPDSPEIILTAGGTGLGPRDVTPEATKDILDKEVPGLAEAMRAQSLKLTPAAMLSRAIAGIRKKTLIINLPGSPKGARENLEAVMPALPHAVEIIRSKITDCQQSSTKR
jgi:molybdopterin adenylyltransferase